MTARAKMIVLATLFCVTAILAFLPYATDIWRAGFFHLLGSMNLLHRVFDIQFLLIGMALCAAGITAACVKFCMPRVGPFLLLVVRRDELRPHFLDKANRRMASKGALAAYSFLSEASRLLTTDLAWLKQAAGVHPDAVVRLTSPLAHKARCRLRMAGYIVERNPPWRANLYRVKYSAGRLLIWGMPEAKPYVWHLVWVRR